MGRLFWKFFFFLWLAQVLTTVGVSVAVWALRAEHQRARIAAMEGPPPGVPPGMPPLPRRELGPPMPRHGWHRPAFIPPLMPLIAGSIASVLIAALLAWYFARPISSLKRAFEDLAGGKLGTRIGAAMNERHDELADLGSDFDRMAERMQGLLDGQRRLLHDVSHEIRSPLARLQAVAGLMRQQPEKTSEYLERIERDTARIDALVGELLTLARLDAGTLGKARAEVDLAALLEQIAEDAEIEAQAKGCELKLECPPALSVQGDQELLGRAIENLVRNAIRYSPSGSPIGLAAGVDESAPEIWIGVRDAGPGVAESELQAIFEPFYRARNNSSNDGYGLGLAIAQRIATAHGGSIFARNRPQGGLEVTLRLPAAH